MSYCNYFVRVYGNKDTDNVNKQDIQFINLDNLMIYQSSLGDLKSNISLRGQNSQ